MLLGIEINKPILKRIWKHKRLKIVQTVFKQKKVGECTLPEFKPLHKLQNLRHLGIGIKIAAEKSTINPCLQLADLNR
jgi:hypothetical protein